MIAALFRRIHNFILLLSLEKDRVCACTCGSHQVYHVVPYNEVQSEVDSRTNYFLSDFVTRQETDVIVGLLSGLCISWFLQWLERVWHSWLKHWRANRANDVGFWSRMPKFSNIRDLFRQMEPQDSRENMVQTNRDLCLNVNGRI